MAPKVAIVTGSNKGIGFAVVRGMCKKFDGNVYLTARDETRGKQAVTDLEKEGLKPRFHQLDINSTESIDRLAKYVKETYGGVDILVNNAGMAYKNDSTASAAEQAEVSIATNFWGTENVTKAFLPLLRPGARVVHVSSMVAPMIWKKISEPRRDAFNKCSTVEEVGSCLQNFIDDTKANRMEGWPTSNYGMSKVGLTLITPIHQRMADSAGNTDVLVNACCPGYVDTDMTSHKGQLTIDQGAENPLYLAFLPAGSDIKGQFIQKLKVVDWKQ